VSIKLKLIFLPSFSQTKFSTFSTSLVSCSIFDAKNFSESFLPTISSSILLARVDFPEFGAP